MCHYRDLNKYYNPVTRLRWTKSGKKEFGRLCQGYGEEQGMDVIEWIPRADLPHDKTATYPRYMVAYRPEKDDPFRTRITAGGDRLEYFGDVTTHRRDGSIQDPHQQHHINPRHQMLHCWHLQHVPMLTTRTTWVCKVQDPYDTRVHYPTL